MESLPSFTIGQNSPGKCVLFILERKNVFLDYKNRELKKSKQVDFFQKGLVHGFCQKLELFLCFYFGKRGQENLFYDILKGKNAFLDYKDYRLKQLEKHRLKKVEKLGFVYCPLNLSIVLVKIF